MFYIIFNVLRFGTNLIIDRYKKKHNVLAMWNYIMLILPLQSIIIVPFPSIYYSVLQINHQCMQCLYIIIRIYIASTSCIYV